MAYYIYICWKCERTVPGQHHDKNLFTEWLDRGSPEEPHNLIYIDQDYFCAHPEYGCNWDAALGKGDFLYDYFNIVRSISNNHGTDIGGYDSVVVGFPGTWFDGF